MDALNTKIKNIKTEKTLKVRPENIKSGVNIFGINGSVTELNGETATVTPTTSSQTITPTGTGKNALTSVTVNAVTNSIDNNITAGNIKNGVTILGVQGTYEGEEKPYRELLYIQSSGTQYIDTGLKSSSSLKIECVFSIIDTTAARNYVFGVMENNTNRLQFSYSYFNNVYGFGDKYNTPANSNHNTNIHTVILENGVFTIDGEVVQTLTADNFISTNYNLCLFAINIDGTIGTLASIKLYNAKIYNNNVLVRDFIPVQRKNDGEICLYDKVSKNYFTNSGSGSFIAGATPEGTINITQNGTVDVTNYASANVNVASSPSFPPDWSELGYSSTPQKIIDAFNYAKTILQNWDSSTTDMTAKYFNNRSIIYMPSLNTSNVTSLQQAFGSCSYMVKVGMLDTSKVTSMRETFLSCGSLLEVPQFNTSRVTNFYNCFNGCVLLTDDSLNNILGMCIGATSYTGTKTLYEMGLREFYFPLSKLQTLSNWTAFTNAGWTTGY